MNNINQRFAKALAGIKPVQKDQTANVGKYTYAYTSLTDVLAVVKVSLADHGLAVAQPVRTEEGVLFVDTVIFDQKSEDLLTFPGMGAKLMSDPQANGSSISYARRYNLTSLFALEVGDDDGAIAAEAASRPQDRPMTDDEIEKFADNCTSNGLDAYAIMLTAKMSDPPMISEKPALAHAFTEAKKAHAESPSNDSGSQPSTDTPNTPDTDTGDGSLNPDSILMSDHQRKKLFAMMPDMDRAERLHWAAGHLDRKVASYNVLTGEDADNLIGILERQEAADQDETK